MIDKKLNISSYLELYEQRCKDEENKKVEFINGVITCSSSTSILHNKIVFRLAANLDDFLSDTKCDVFSDGIELILEEGEQGSYVKPDIFITCNTTYKGQSVTSIPLIVFEVVSEGNPENDYERKYKLYRKYGIREYNIIEQNGNIVQYTIQNDFYHVTNTFKNGDTFTSSVLTDFKINTSKLFNM